ncbi:hypothetical protein [Clostridium sp.]|uniref:hypothetical protein n=1 Tax=Clostridium sp. TaxID=1506 RepID=UPI0025C53E08|nr:hypothetical protein [Clostridium sp.]
MRDSFNNELQVGDRVLCLEPREFNMYRKNQVGTIAEMNYNRMIVNYDFYEGRGWSHPELNIQSGHGNCIIPNEDTFVKIETHTEVEYRVRDKVLCYCTTISNIPFVGKIIEKLSHEIYYIVDELGNEWVMLSSEILFLLERKHFKIGDEIVVQKTLNFELLFREGYNQSIPARVDDTDIAYTIIEMDNPSIGWQKNNDINHSYWTFTDTKRLLPREFSYSLPLVEYLKCYNPEILNGSEQTNSTEETSIEEDRTISNESTPKLIHNYNYTPDETRFCRAEDEEHNEDNLYLGIELEISGSSQESDNEEDAREIMKAIQKDVESSGKSVYFKHDGSINGFEIVFQPHTVKAYNEYQWKEIFSTIRKLGYTNDDKKAGLHIHISRSYFGDESQQNEALAKMVFLMYKFKEEIEPLAGRKDSDYATYSAKALKRVKENDLFGTFRWYCDSCGKYSAINCQHKNTFEIRIFDGVTDKVRFRDILNFVENLCIIVKCTSITDITKIRLEDFMPFLRSIEG